MFTEHCWPIIITKLLLIIMITVDTRGHACPTPLIMTKRAITQLLKDSSIDRDILVLADNEIAKCNLLDYIAELGYVADCGVRSAVASASTNTSMSNNGGVWEIRFSVGASDLTDVVRTADYERVDQVPVVCGVNNTPVNKSSKDYVVVIKGQTMGAGDDQLGMLLMRACVNSLPELEQMPRAVILYNGGVKLAVKGCDTADSLLKMAGAGVNIVVCGTCVDYYGIKDELAVGVISNMFKINSLVAEAGHVVYP